MARKPKLYTASVLLNKTHMDHLTREVERDRFTSRSEAIRYAVDQDERITQGLLKVEAPPQREVEIYVRVREADSLSDVEYPDHYYNREEWLSNELMAAFAADERGKAPELAELARANCTNPYIIFLDGLKERLRRYADEEARWRHGGDLPTAAQADFASDQPELQPRDAAAEDAVWDAPAAAEEESDE